MGGEPPRCTCSSGCRWRATSTWRTPAVRRRPAWRRWTWTATPRSGTSATLPEARGRGLATALMRQALLDAGERGCVTTSLQATAMGRPVYARMGYRDLGAARDVGAPARGLSEARALPRITRHAHRPAPGLVRRAGVLVRVLPPAHGGGRGATCSRRCARCATWTPRSSRSPTARAAPPAIGRSRSRAGSSRTWGWRRWPTCRCVGATREELAAILDRVHAAGIENVLALRGDPPRGETEWRPTPGGLRYSTELAQLIGERHDFCIGAACFPEVHPEAPDLESDLRFLGEKVAAGASFLITQLFFDNRAVLRLGRAGPRGRHRRCRSCRDHAGDQRRAGQALHVDVRCVDPAGAAGAAGARALTIPRR